MHVDLWLSEFQKGLFVILSGTPKCLTIRIINRSISSLSLQENFGRREQHLEQHYNDVLQTLSQRYDERSTGLETEKKGKLEALYTQLLACGQAMDASKELIEMAREIYRCHDKRLFLKVWSYYLNIQ